MNLSEYINRLHGKKIAVIGIGISNTPLIGLLLDNGCSVTACDRRERNVLGETALKLESRGAALHLGAEYLKGLDADVIFRTPGLRPDVPELIEALEKGAVLTSEMEAFFEVCPCRTIGVTGSDGKTTTTSIIAEILREAGQHVFVGGNIGTPLFCRAGEMNAHDIAVLELSSFQLMTMTSSPDIAVVTNVAPNHLDIHRSMEEYIEAKRNILKYQGHSCRAVLNYDNKITREFAASTAGEVLLFSRLERVKNGVFLDGNVIMETDGAGTKPIMQASEIFLRGAHNIENYMAAFAALRGFAKEDVFRHVASEFKGVEHRIELVRTLHGVTYYNDSIASSPTRTIAGLHSFGKKVILIAGGKDKGVPFNELGTEIIEHVKTLVLTGFTAEKLREAVVNAPGYSGSPDIIMKDDFAGAVKAASQAAEEGDIVILSPACTSFDKFNNFEERGNTFKEIVNRLE